MLLADDHTLFRKGVRNLLELMKDIEVVGEAATGPEAVSQAKKLVPDVILMDIKMPGQIDGIQAALRIQELYPTIPIIFVTAFGSNENYRRTVSESGLKIVRWIDKPVAGRNRENLLDILNIIEIILQKTKR